MPTKHAGGVQLKHNDTKGAMSKPWLQNPSLGSLVEATPARNPANATIGMR
eukprot:CAMPEP_0204355032 /NCGR_PEP_ID=MMETSP0469-20131031/33843_1 /ASSEMBLY_ACC=CAM_ASM_000384 /TAXON_ID=2969 /ORGANISM="Oxyrrhis marina" /LENGTH=50 /DNA_ID=CAMNT_0051342221 /DNA_START=86 /DNA_END=238 /DNA_ORIENTATION=+